MKIIKNCFIGLFVLIFYWSCLSESKNKIHVDPISVINEFLPDSVKLLKENGEDVIEFCPDNTCELFVAKKATTEESLKDFAYLYVCFISDYCVLDEWRKKENPAKMAGFILSKPKYKICNGKTDADKALCILEYLSKGDKISIYDVRYDENYRSKEKKELSETLRKVRRKAKH